MSSPTSLLPIILLIFRAQYMFVVCAVTFCPSTDVLPDWMNDVQHISAEKHGNLYVTLNPPQRPDPAKIIGRYKYDHPMLDANVSQAIDCCRYSDTLL